ncbi:MAG: glycosyltransferase family 87 protein [Micromonosporaceae bacterium]
MSDSATRAGTRAREAGWRSGRGLGGAVGRGVLLAAVTAAVAIGQVWYGNRHGFFDLKIYRLAMRWWADGHPLYTFAKPDATQGELGFTYPPFAAVLLRPLAWLSVGAAETIFVVVSGAALAVSVYWLVRPVADRHGQPRWFAVGLAFVLATALEPIRETITFGQINLLLFALVLADLLWLAPRGSRLTGIGIGIATAIKLVPGVFILYLLACRRWRAAAVATGTAAAATLLAAAVAPRDSWEFWTRQLRHADGIGNLDYFSNQSLLGLLARLAPSGQPPGALWLAVALPILGYGLWRAARSAGVIGTARSGSGGTGDEVAGLTLAGLAGSLASPVTWHHHLVWFVPALVVLVDAALGTPRRFEPLALRPDSPAVRPTGRQPAWLWALAGLTYATVTFSVISLAEFTLDHPGGVVGFVLINWFVLLSLVLLFTLPARTAGKVTGG